MADLKLQRTRTKGSSGETIRFEYDQGSDVLEIFFGENELATGIELTDHILLRLNRTTGRAVSLTPLHFSILTEKTEYGPRSYALDKLDDLQEDLRELVIRTVTSEPVNRFIKLSHFQDTPTRHVPITYVEPHRFEFVA